MISSWQFEQGFFLVSTYPWQLNNPSILVSDSWSEAGLRRYHPKNPAQKFLGLILGPRCHKGKWRGKGWSWRYEHFSCHGTWAGGIYFQLEKEKMILKIYHIMNSHQYDIYISFSTSMCSFYFRWNLSVSWQRRGNAWLWSWACPWAILKGNLWGASAFCFGCDGQKLSCEFTAALC